ncbi:MAG: DUF87 domain-containing protein, partial [Candidatus Pacearchaeota archaeon]
FSVRIIISVVVFILFLIIQKSYNAYIKYNGDTPFFPLGAARYFIIFALIISISNLLPLYRKYERFQKVELKLLDKPLYNINDRNYKGYFKMEELLKFLYRPNYIENNYGYIRINENYYKVLTATGFSQKVRAGFLDSLMKSPIDADFVIDINVIPRKDKVRELNQSYAKALDEKDKSDKEGIKDRVVENQLKGEIAALDALSLGQDNAFHVGFHIKVKAGDPQTMELSTKEIIDELEGKMIETKANNLDYEDAFKTFLPIDYDGLSEKDFLTSSLASFYPFTSDYSKIIHHAPIIGINPDTQIPIILDIFSLPNANGLVLGASGSGKSVSVKNILGRHLMIGDYAFIIDPNNEYEPISKRFGGTHIKLSPDSKSIPNWMDLRGEKRDDRVESSKAFMKLLIPQVTDAQLERHVEMAEKTYEKFGIYRDTDPNVTEVTIDGIKKPFYNPYFQDYYNTLNSEISKQIADGGKPDKELVNLKRHVRPFVEGAYRYMSQNPKIDWNNKLIVFAIDGMSDSTAGALMYLVLELIMKKMRDIRAEAIRDIKANKSVELIRFIILIDEAWKLFASLGEGYVKKIAKIIRKYNGSLLLVTQQLEDLQSEGGRAVLANTSMKLLLKQDSTVINELKNTFHLTDEQAEYLTGNIGKGEGILMVDSRKMKYKSELTPLELEIATTTVSQMKEMKSKKEILRQKLFAKIMNAGSRELSENERKEFEVIDDKKNPSDIEKRKHDLLKDKIEELGKKALSEVELLEWEDMKYLDTLDFSDSQTETENVVKKKEVPGVIQKTKGIRDEILLDDERQDCYLKESLTDEEQSKLKSLDYGEISYQYGDDRYNAVTFFVRIKHHKSKEYISPEIVHKLSDPKGRSHFLKENKSNINTIENVDHFMLSRIAKLLIEEQGLKVEKLEDQSRKDKGDVPFFNKVNKECNFEIETGSRKYQTDEMKKKIKVMNETFGARWAIVIQNSKLKEIYEKDFDSEEDADNHIILKTKIKNKIKEWNVA